MRNLLSEASEKSSLHVPVTVAILAMIGSSCSSGPKLPPEVAATGKGKDLETIVILGTNDIHGALAPIESKTREAPGVEPVKYERGGASIFAFHVRTLRRQFGEHLLLLDAGDEYQGSIESNLAEGAPMIQFFNAIGLSAAAVGNHEFDFGPVGPEGVQGDPLGALKERMSEARFPYVASNIVEKSTGKMPPLPNARTRVILPAGRLKVGVIGLSTLDTPVTTRPEFVRELRFTDLREATLREAEALRKEGADLIVVTAHAGLRCELGRAPFTASFRKPDDPLGDCDPGDEMARLLNSLPPGAIDAAVSGHSHTLVHHWVNGIPVIQGGTRALYYNLIYLTYDHAQKKVLADRTRIEGPIPVCAQVFENQGDCNGDRPAPRSGRGKLVQATFRGLPVEPDPEVAALMEPVFARTTEEKIKVIGQAARPVEHDRTRESELGNLVSDAIRAKVQADVAIVNGGGIRAPWEAGDVTFGDLFRTLPFDNSISVLTVTGKELKALLRVSQSGARGFFPVSGLRLRLIDLEYDAPSSDLDHDGRIEPWEINRLIEAKLADGSPIRDQKKYTVATVDFLVGGGDDWGWAMAQIPAERVRVNAGGVIRDAVQEYVAKAGPLNPPEKPLVDPTNPRIILEKSAKKKRRR